MNKKLTRTALIIRLELARLFGYRQHQNKSLILRCSRKHFAQLAEVSVRQVSNAYAELAAGGWATFRQPRTAKEEKYQTNVIKPGLALFGMIHHEAAALLGRFQTFAREVYKRTGQAWSRGKSSAHVLEKTIKNKKKKAKNPKVEDSNQLPVPFFEPSTHLSKEIVARLTTLQAKIFPPAPEPG